MVDLFFYLTYLLCFLLLNYKQMTDHSDRINALTVQLTTTSTPLLQSSPCSLQHVSCIMILISLSVPHYLVFLLSSDIQNHCWIFHHVMADKESFLVDI